MIILGIDPGTTSIGYALIQGTRHKPILIDAGLLSIKSRSTEDRLKELHLGIQEIIKAKKPDTLAIERVFFAKNQKTALAVSEARGVVLLTTALAGLKICEYTPLEIKKIITGDGRADKLQLKKMVQLIMPEVSLIKYQDDTYDAVSIALACLYLVEKDYL
ncbi:MAG: crossover junction endodeoxyribonuclease RuvC [bacterium]|nr:crossover junction endodeoxyribonuclease RuvC [bacterium]